MAKINLEKFKAPNEDLNVTITQALQFQQMLADFGMQFDSIVAIQGSAPQEGADEIDLVMLQAMKVPAETQFYFNGRYKNRTDRSFEIGLERVQILGVGGPEGPGAPLDGASTFVFLWTERNPGQTLQAAIAAADSIPTIQAAKVAALDAIRAQLV